MLNVLMVEDDVDVANTLKDLAEEQLAGVNFHIEHSFGGVKDRLADLRPDVVVLDLADDETDGTELPGIEVWDEVWDRRFCPIVIYTARAESFEDRVPLDHPFVRLVAKGPDTDKKVVSILVGFASHVQGIHDVEERMLQVAQQVLRDVSLHVFQGELDEDVRHDMLMRAARRRIAAVLDHDSIEKDRQLATWEKYIVPPLEPDLMMADLIRERQKDVSDVKGYRLIVTPTCDMIKSQGPKVESALVARCREWKAFFTIGANLDANTGVSKVKKKLAALLRDGYSDGYVLLPEYPNFFPSVAVDLRDLELVPLDTIGGPDDSNADFIRVASIDSPFRERLAWNYLQVTGRPGTPACNNDPWKQSILQEWSQS